MRGTVVPFFLRTMVRVRRFFSRLMNRNFMVFLFFLFLSAAFWVFLALDDEYEREFDVPLELVNVPENVVITTPLPETFHVVLKDRGSQLINYHYAGLPKVTVDFTNYDRHLGMVSFPVTDITKQLVQKMSTSTRLVSAKPERLEYLFNFGMHVRMPVRLHATVKAEASYAVSSVRVKPDSVTVKITSGESILDSITNDNLELFIEYNRFAIEDVDSLAPTVKLKLAPGINREMSIKAIEVIPDKISLVRKEVKPIVVEKRNEDYGEEEDEEDDDE